MQAARAASAASGAASISGRHLGAQQRPAAPLPHRLRANPAGARRLTCTAAAATEQQYGAHRPTKPSAYVLSSGIVDYYELLSIDDTASVQEVKAAYRALAKVCHVDIAGDSPDNRNMCILLNEAYEVLMDPEQRQVYNAELDAALADEDDGYTGEPLSRWCANTKMGKNTDPNESRAVFVDEVACIGCKQCVWVAPATFRMEDTHGRSRVFGQWLDKEDDIQAAMLACPVSCIHWVDKADLPALEFVCQNKVKRTNVAAMMAAQGGAVDDVWNATAKYLKDRKRREEERARAARYSAAAEAARRSAADAIMQRQDGWFDSLAAKWGVSNLAASAAAAMESSLLGSMGASYASDDEYAGYTRVGRRTRTRRRVDGSYGARGASGGKVPRDRALVPAGAALRPWRRDV